MANIQDMAELAHPGQMTTLLASDAAPILKTARETIGTVASFKPEELIRADLKDFSFDSATDRILEVIRLSREISDAGLGGLPKSQIAPLAQSATNVAAAAAGLRDFSLKIMGNTRDGSITHERDRRETVFVEAAQAYIATIVPVMGYAAARTLSGITEADPREGLRSIESAVRRATQAAEQIAEMAKASAATTRQIGVDSNARYFGAQANEHHEAGKRWLVATVLSAAVAAGWAGYVYVHALKAAEPIAATLRPPTAGQLTQLAVAKLLIFSVLLSATIWCARVYRAHRHNYIVNRHRQNALSSFEVFSSSTQDAQVKNAVVIQATASIFAPQPTGYGAADVDAGHPQLVEFIRTVTEPQK